MLGERDLTSPSNRIKWAIDRVKEKKGMGLEALAKEIGTSHATLSQWQTGSTNIANVKVSLLMEFAKKTDVSLHWLLTGQGPRSDKPNYSEEVSHLSEKLTAMERDAPYQFSLVRRMIDAAADDVEPPAH